MATSKPNKPNLSAAWVACAFTLLVSACAAPARPAPAAPAAPPSITESKAIVDYEAAPAATTAPAAMEMPAATEAPKATEAPAASGAVAASIVDKAAAPAEQAYVPISAGSVDDNANWADYLRYRERNPNIVPPQHNKDVTERYIINIKDAQERPVPDAAVQISVGSETVFTGRTDAGGRLLFHPRAIGAHAAEYGLTVKKGNASQQAKFAAGQANDATWPVTLPDAPIAARAKLDLVFLVDVTGSMDDELSKLQAAMHVMADQIARLPQEPDIHFGLVAYGDRGDAFVVRGYDFTPDLAQFQAQLNAMPTVGGGDTPESLNAGLHYALNNMSWRDEDAVRLVILVADAEPHLDYADENFAYSTDMIAAVGKGIKIITIGASGLSEQGAYIYRQLAQFTGGRFVFLTYAQAGNSASGPGTQTDHDVQNYSVDTLDRLIVTLVRDELAKLPKAG